MSVSKKALHISIEELRCRYDFDEFAGIFTRRFCPDLGLWGSSKTAGSDHHTGYVFITIDGINYAAHRLAWAYVHGEWPRNEIDHINRVRSDNRINNLREVNRTQNNWNASIRNDNSTGCRGVSQDKRYPLKWLARIQVNGKRVYLGSFRKYNEAVKAYQLASRREFGEYCGHGLKDATP